MIQKAMILAAGLGTRMQPLTDHMPKALVPWKGKAMLEWVLEKLKSAGINEVIINLHHYPEQIIRFLESKQHFGMQLTFSHEDRLLDTGGGVRKAAWFFDKGPVLVHNVDINSSINIEKLYTQHVNSGAQFTLAVKDRPTSRNFLMDEKGFLAGWKNNSSGETILCRDEKELLTPVAFSGIQVIEPAALELFTEEDPFSLTTAYLRIARDNPVHLYRHDADTWIDMSRLS